MRAAALRFAARVAGALPLVVASLLLVPAPVSAMSPARVAAAQCMRDLTAQAGRWNVDDADLVETVDCLDGNGALLARTPLRDDVTAHAARVLHPGDPPPDGPAPGDVVTYTDVTTGVRHPRIALVVDAAEVVVIDPLADRFVALPLAQLEDLSPLAAGGRANRGPVADTSTVHVWRLDASAWPGSGDLALPPGKVELMDPRHMADLLQWSASHPRDADTSLTHQVAVNLGVVTSVLSSMLDSVLSGTLAVAGWALHRMGPVGAVVLAIAGFLSTRFDGRALHVVLTAGLLLLIAPELALFAVAAQALPLRDIPLLGGVLGTAGDVLWNVAGFTVTLVTGVDDGPTSLASVLFALVSIPVVWERAFCVAARLTLPLRAVMPLASRFTALVVAGIDRLGVAGTLLGRAGMPVIRAAGHVGDAVTLRPSEVLAAMRVGAARQAPHLAGLLEQERWLEGAAVARRGAVGAADVGSALLWRSGQLPGEIFERGADLTAWLSRGAGSGHGWPFASFHRWLAELEPARRDAVLRAVRAARFDGAPLLRAYGDGYRVHSGAGITAQVAGGNVPQPLQPPPRPVVAELSPLPPDAS